MDYVSFETVPHLGAVELGTAGMEWEAATGPFTLTLEHIADIVVAANEDPHVQVPRIRIGHSSSLNDGMPRYEPFAALGDGEPAFGRIINLRTTNAGAVLVGDMIDVPEWLADAMPSAYPNRSGEWRQDVTTPGGKHYTMVLTAMALGGVWLPAIADLEDLERLLDEGPAAFAEPEPAETAGGGSNVPRTPTADTSMSVGLIRDRFNFDWATSDPIDGLDTYWWWARDVRVDPNEIIVDDDEGGLWRVPFTTDGADEITFDTPVRVREDFVDLPPDSQPDAVATAAPIASGQQVLASNLGRPSKPTPNAAASRSSNTNTPEEGTMTPEELALLGLPEDATDEQIAARQEQIAELNDGTPSGETEIEETDEPAAEADAEAEATENEPEPIAARGVVIDRDALAELQAGAAAGTEARTAQLTADRASFIETAVKAGKFPPSAATAYRAQLDQGGEVEKETRAFIETLASDVIPVTERGAETTADDAVVSSDEPLPDNVSILTPAERAQRAS